MQNHIVVAVDLPGYGGSDGVPSYGAFDVLETMSEFIIGMRQQFLQDDKKVVVVTHDWGALIGCRLVAEAKALADHWIITSAIIVSHIGQAMLTVCLRHFLASPHSVQRPF